MLRELRTGRRLATLLMALTLASFGALLMLRGARPADAAPAASLASALPGSLASEDPRDWRKELAWPRVRHEGAGYVQALPDGGRIELTLDPSLQRESERALSELGAPYASAVVVSVDDGRVLAMAGRSSADHSLDAADLSL